MRARGPPCERWASSVAALRVMILVTSSDRVEPCRMILKLRRKPITRPLSKDNARLDGWREIASFLSRGIRTIRRWEKDYALPVRRLFKHRRSRVHAYRKELAHWVKRREEHPSLTAYRTSESQPDRGSKPQRAS